MRQTADTPPPAAKTTNTRGVSFAPTPEAPSNEQQQQEEESVELRMQRQLTEETKKKQELYQKVAALEDELTERTLQQAKNVATTTTSPSRTVPSQPPEKLLTPPRKSRPATPHPKQAITIDPQFLEQATEAVEYKFESDETEEDDGGVPGAVFVVRRPFDYASSDRDLWFAAGEMSAKMYAHKATVHNVATIEVAVQIPADDSILLLYNEADVRHQNAVQGVWNKYGEFVEGGPPLGNVSYIDTDANEKEYSLDDLVIQAIEVRKQYCASVKGMALGLQRQAQEGGPTPSMTMPHSNGASGGPPPLVPEGMVSETPLSPPAQQPMPKEPPSAPPPVVPPPSPRPMTHEPQSDVFSVFTSMLAFIVYTCIKFPFDVVYTLLRWSCAGLLGLFIYICLLHAMDMTGIAPPLYYYHNPPGIM
jgi:hypothetical protein